MDSSGRPMLAHQGARPRRPRGRSRPRRPGCRCARGGRRARRPASPWPASTAGAAAPVGTPKPNLESSWPVRTNSWVWASTPGRDADQHLRARRPSSACSASRRSSSSKLSTTMRPTPAARARAQLVERLVVAVQDEAVGGHAGGQGDVELAAGRDVEVHALLVREPGHGRAEERLGGVGDAVAEGGHRLPAAGPQVGLVVDEQRRAELARPARAGRSRRSCRRPSASDGAPCRAAARCGPSGAGQRRRRSHRLGGGHAEQVEADGEPMRAASTSHSRAWVSSGGTSPMT